LYQNEQLRNLIANITVMKQDIIKQKKALQTAISPAHAACTLKFGNFDPQTTENRTRVSTDLARSLMIGRVLSSSKT